MADDKKDAGRLDNLLNAFKATLLEAGIAFITVFALNSHSGAPLWFFFPIWFAFYMFSCFFWYKRKCWWCAGKRENNDGRGNIRDYSCWLCGGDGRRPRWGARIMGRA